MRSGLRGRAPHSTADKLKNLELLEVQTGFDRGHFVMCVDDADEGRRTSFNAANFPPVLLLLHYSACTVSPCTPMSAVDALTAARAAGVHLSVDGDDLVLEAATSPPPAVINLLSGHKAEVVALLRPAEEGWSAEDWHVFYDEWAGIAEFDGGLPRAEAEAQAFACCVVEWLNHNPESSPAGRCLNVVAAIMPMIRCCPTASNPPAMPGCIRVAGAPGIIHGRPKRSPHWPRWGS